MPGAWYTIVAMPLAQEIRSIKRLSLTLATALIVISTAPHPAGQTCPLQSPPPPFGENGYTGQSGYVFDYSADAGATRGMHYFQLLVKNKGTNPLTFDWESAMFFRRGVESGLEVRSQCRSDGNAPNVAHGLIKYGPNTQFTGPDARFYDFQRQAARAMLQVPQRQPAVNKTSFGIRWIAVLETGKQYVVDFTVTASPAGETLEYEFSNYGAPVHIEWPTMLSPSILKLAQVQNAKQPVVVKDRLALPAGKAAVPFRFAGKGQITSVSAPLSVFTPEGLLLYRDVFAGLQFITQAGR